MYAEFKPSPRISNLVDSFWTFECGEKGEKYKILPDNCADFIFDLRYEKAYLSGVMNTYCIQDSLPHTLLIGIRFSAESLRLVSKVPVSELRNLRVDLEDIYPSNTKQILENLCEKASLKERLHILEGFLLRLKGKIDLKQDQTILAITKSIRASKGRLQIRELAAQFHLSLRQLERRFKSNVGLTPKEYSNIVRLHETKNRIAEHRSKSILHIAYEMGYYDSSHMTKDFQRLAGANPNFFL